MATRETEAVERYMGPISSSLKPEADGQWVRFEDYERVRKNVEFFASLASEASERLQDAQARADQAQALLTQLLEAVEEHQESSKPFRDQWLYKTASEIREQSESREG